jgi:OTU domain-containing protein 6
LRLILILLSKNFVFSDGHERSSGMEEEDLDSLLSRHKKEQKALVSQITSLKKTVTKGEKAKRKEVLTEVDRLEKEQKNRHQHELEQLKSRQEASKPVENEPSLSPRENEPIANESLEGVEQLSLQDTKKAKGGKRRVNRQAARLVGV